MYTSLIVLAMVGASADLTGPSWQTYSQASQRVDVEKKPVAVFLGSGQRGWEQVAGSLGVDAEQVLAASYVCAYVDTSTSEGQKLARAFQMPNGVGVVLSDRKGETQAYWHNGELPQTDLVRQLVRHSNSTRRSSYMADDTVMGTASSALQGGNYCPT